MCQLGLAKSFQINQLFPSLSVSNNIRIATLARRYGKFYPSMLRDIEHDADIRRATAEAIEAVQLSGRADVPASELAYGEKRRLEIGLALATKPRVLLLDEPTAGMSPSERTETVQLLKRIAAGITIVIVEHDMDVVFGACRSRYGALQRSQDCGRFARKRFRRMRKYLPRRLSRGPCKYMTGLLEVNAINTYYGDAHARCSTSRYPCPMEQHEGSGSPRPQRRGQEHDDENNHGRDGAEERYRPFRRTCDRKSASLQNCAPWYTACAGGAPYYRRPYGR